MQIDMKGEDDIFLSSFSAQPYRMLDSSENWKVTLSRCQIKSWLRPLLLPTRK